MPNRNRIDAVLHAGLEEIPGIVAMATTAGGTIYEGAAGAVPMTTNAIFALASMTKAVVSVAALQQVDQGRLSLDAPIAKVLPELAAPQVLEGFTADGVASLRPARGAITLRHLLSHSAGYGYGVVNQQLAMFLQRNGLPAFPESNAQVARWPLLFDPGTRWNYGINTDIVGKAIEAVTGQRLDLHMAGGLLAQLGMTDSGFVLTPEHRPRLVTVQARGADGRFTDQGLPTDGGVRWGMGGGGMHGTGRDYLRFIRLILNGGVHEGTRILSAAGMAAATRNQLAPGVAVELMKSSNPALWLTAEFFPEMTKQWSAAFMINTERADTGRNAGSLAWAGVLNTCFWIDPTAGIGGVFLTQTRPFYDPHVMAAFAAFERAVYEMVA
jgi:methyl acetate hydrolase